MKQYIPEGNNSKTGFKTMDIMKNPPGKIANPSKLTELVAKLDPSKIEDEKHFDSPPKIYVEKVDHSSCI